MSSVSVIEPRSVASGPPSGGSSSTSGSLSGPSPSCSPRPATTSRTAVPGESEGRPGHLAWGLGPHVLHELAKGLVGEKPKATGRIWRGVVEEAERHYFALVGP